MRNKKYPYLVEQLGKHSNDMYLIQSEEDLGKASLEIIKNYKDCGYLFLDKSSNKTFDEYVLEQVGLTLSEIEAMTKGKTANLKVQFIKYGAASTPADQIKKLQQEYNSEQSHNNAIKSALQSLKDKDGKLANQVVNYFSSRDYEYMTIRNHSFVNIK